MQICGVCLVSFPGPKCSCHFDSNVFELLHLMNDNSIKPQELSALQVATIANYKSLGKNVPRKFNKDAGPSPALQAIEEDRRLATARAENAELQLATLHKEAQNLEEAVRLATARAEQAELKLATLHKHAQTYAQKAEERIGYLQSILHFFGIKY